MNPAFDAAIILGARLQAAGYPVLDGRDGWWMTLMPDGYTVVARAEGCEPVEFDIREFLGPQADPVSFRRAFEAQ